jgi:hypothetical protein
MVAVAAVAAKWVKPTQDVMVVMALSSSGIGFNRGNHHG